MVALLTKNDLAELRSRNKIERAEIAADLERRVAEDPCLDLQVTRSVPALIYKRRTDNGNNGDAFDGSEPAPLLDADTIADGVAAAIAAVCDTLRGEIADAIDPLRERLTVVETQLETLLAVIGGANNNNSRSRSRKGT
jgi:hypothetical protein